jgi:hypothetical protein
MLTFIYSYLHLSHFMSFHVMIISLLLKCFTYFVFHFFEYFADYVQVHHFLVHCNSCAYEKHNA